MLERVQDDLNHRVSACTCVAAASVRVYIYTYMYICMSVVWVYESVSSCVLPDVHPRDQAFCTLSLFICMPLASLAVIIALI